MKRQISQKLLVFIYQITRRHIQKYRNLTIMTMSIPHLTKLPPCVLKFYLSICQEDEGKLTKKIEVFHSEVLKHTNKYYTSAINTTFIFIYNCIYVRATCFDLVCHPQALQKHRIKRCLVFLHCGIPNATTFSYTSKKYISLYTF